MTMTLRATAPMAAVLAILFAVGCGARPVPIESDLGPRCAWRPMASPTTAILYDVCGRAADDIYAAGKHNTLIHFDGKHWRAVPTPPGVKGVDLRVTCTANAVVVLGETATLLSADTWTLLPPRFRPIWGGLSSAWIETPDRIYFGTYQNGLLLFEHGRWRQTYTSDSGISNLAGTPSGQVVATSEPGIIMHFDGVRWKQVETGTQDYYPSVWGRDDLGFYIVAVHGKVLHYDGKVLRTIFDISLPYSMVDVWGTAADNIYVVGKGIWHFDGATWTQVFPHDGIVFDSIWGTGPANIFAVGHNGRILRYTCRGS
ncbi:MAG: hypothetical protein KAI47_11605 [Deltaproteobacteria bacterium]|nr:hypothetical protein [Deltaproteobacteria bacterium]